MKRLLNIIALFAASFLLLQRCIGAHKAPPVILVNATDADPLETCKRIFVQLFESGNRVYMYGGRSWVRNGTQPWYPVCNHYLRIADFTRARNLSDPTILDVKDIPGNITIFDKGAFWVDSKKAYIVGGEVDSEPWLSWEGELLRSNYTAFKGSTIFSYGLATEKWSSEPAVQPNSGAQVNDSFSDGAFAYNAEFGKAFYFSGNNWAGARRAYPNIGPEDDYEFVDRDHSEVSGNGNLLIFDTASFRWTNSTTDTQLTTTGTGSGQLVFLPSTKSSSGGLAIFFGGQKRNDQTMDMRKVLVYDSATSKFYSQITTSEGDHPEGRRSFCAVAVSAPDASSHNIFVYGGESTVHTDIPFSDMWILSVPSFHWIKLDVQSLPAKFLGCTLVGGKYMLTYGGNSTGSMGAGIQEHCDDQNYGLRLFDLTTLMWTSQYAGPASNKKNVFEIPKALYAIIGGNNQGGATLTSPARGFETTELASLFQPTITVSSTEESAVPSSSTNGPRSHSKSNNTSAIAGGVVGGITALAIIIGIVFLILRWKKKKHGSQVPAFTPAVVGADAHQPRLELVGEERLGPQSKPGLHEMYG
ncbi:hypothetical protein P154DRAFT_559494 [Amniculicola lignicola CBS 123094]|uniref:Galactose oxidase n=1 Tax=Amniculicola lignicola CBS 123094 TaxID=1392246 RepID=A0A6A5WZP1_9PLEO|nr:hypothetical protein P154DRAFT_559494 [Amniculicola lignicola CBS 123094]